MASERALFSSLPSFFPALSLVMLFARAPLYLNAWNRLMFKSVDKVVKRAHSSESY